MEKKLSTPLVAIENGRQVWYKLFCLFLYRRYVVHPFIDYHTALSVIRHPPYTPSAREGCRSRVDVACRNRVVDVDQNSRVARLVGTRECHEVGGSLASATRDLNLCTGEVELCASRALSDVQSNVLISHEVLARRNA